MLLVFTAASNKHIDCCYDRADKVNKTEQTFFSLRTGAACIKSKRGYVVE